MTSISSTINNQELQKGLNLLGLKLSENEFAALQAGRITSLKKRSLGEIGSIFILAAAMATKNICKSKSKKTVTFQDLPTTTVDFDTKHLWSGVPTHCWIDDSQKKHCICLTLEETHPAVYCCVSASCVNQTAIARPSDVSDQPKNAQSLEGNV
ncbi:hypothetical protein [Adonisia turfae]|uniref:hypothetical protein n=1 Tax=Adonisia turfae TaxID=2950184 RepID=UPI0020299942|nr:hypothetical protein [Adonisia turfae]